MLVLKRDTEKPDTPAFSLLLFLFFSSLLRFLFFFFSSFLFFLFSSSFSLLLFLFFSSSFSLLLFIFSSLLLFLFFFVSSSFSLLLFLFFFFSSSFEGRNDVISTFALPFLLLFSAFQISDFRSQIPKFCRGTEEKSPKPRFSNGKGPPDFCDGCEF